LLANRATEEASRLVRPVAVAEHAGERLEAVVAGLPDPVIALDRNGRVLTLNERARSLAPALRQGEPVSLALRMPELIEAIGRAYASGEEQRVEYSERVPLDRWFEMIVKPVRREPKLDRPDLVLMTFHDLTPLRRVARFGALIDVRRMIGVGAFCYAVAHLSLFVADQKFDLLKVAGEIASRVYLTIGFTVFCGLLALAVTSTDGMVRRLGGLRWRRLHQIIYVLALFALVHFFQQTKADVTVPTLFAGLFAWLMVYRIVAAVRRERAELPAWLLLALTFAVAGLTFLGEAVGIGIAYGVSPLMVLASAFDFDLAIRPGWTVLAAGLVVVAVDLVRSRWRPLPETVRRSPI